MHKDIFVQGTVLEKTKNKIEKHKIKTYKKSHWLRVRLRYKSKRKTHIYLKKVINLQNLSLRT